MTASLRNHLVSWRRRCVLLLALAVVLPSAVVAQAPDGVASDKIIISGASGHLGELAVEDLLARGVAASRLILVSRTPNDLERYARMGASVRYGDFTKPASLRGAFAGGNRMLLISIGFSGGMPRPQAHRNAIEAAVADGVKHIVYTSWIALSRGDYSGVGADHYATEQILRQSGVAWTMLRNSEYTEELLPQAVKMLATGQAAIPPKDIPVAYVTRADCAAAAAAALSTEGHDYKVYNVTGPALIRTPDIAASLSAVTGRKIADVAAPLPAKPGLGGPAMGIVSNDVQVLTGKAPTSVKSFFEEHRAEILRGGSSAP